MTLSELIAQVDDIKPNAFSNEAKTLWVNEIEGKIQTDVFLMAVENVVQYKYSENADDVLLVNPPHDKLYREYLTAKIDYANGEYNKYENTMQMFNDFYTEFVMWFARNYRPAETHRGKYIDDEL